MPSCCYGDQYGEVFTDREARRKARSYRRTGLSRDAAELVHELTLRGIEGATVLEVGGGLGELHLELLTRGAGSATSIDLSPSWEPAARFLAEQKGVADRVSRLVGDFCDSEIGAFDLVVMHRVVCCYPDWHQMLSRGVERAEKLLALTFPVDRWWTRLGIAAGNLLMKVKGSSFRAFVHPPAEMIDLIRRAGYTMVHDRRRAVWRTVVFEKVS